MKIIVLVKIIPDVENFTYDYEKNVLIRENVKQLINPDDGCALAFALQIKATYPETVVEIITMAPLGVRPVVEDLLRRNIDYGTLISDKLYQGSDSYVTSKILGRCLEGKKFDCILTGTHALDGDTSHVPAQLGAFLKISQMSNIIKIDAQSFCKDFAVVEVDGDYARTTYEMALPAVLSLQKESKYKLPYVKYKDLEMDVSHKLRVVTNERLGFDESEVGLVGSLTKVVRTYVKPLEKRAKVVLRNDQAGIDVIYDFLKEKGFV